MAESQKLALEVVLDWLGKTPTPTSMYVLARDDHEDHLHCITRLLATVADSNLRLPGNTSPLPGLAFWGITNTV